MRLGTFAAFVGGFAAGVLTLALVLWFAGPLRQWHPQWARVPGQEAARELPDVNPLPDTQAAARYPGQPVTPSPLEGPVSQPAPPAGAADRMQPEAARSAPGLLFPVPGVDPRAVPDSFGDARSGHRHEALDIAAPRGTPVLAVAEGNVVKLFTSKQGGLTIYQFDNSQTWCFYYAHLDRYAEGLREGMLLRRGDRIGYVGATGDAGPDNPHLHFAIFRLGPEKNWWQGTAVNPLPFLTGAQTLGKGS